MTHAESAAERPSEQAGEERTRLRAQAARSRSRFVWALHAVTLAAHGLVFGSAWALAQGSVPGRFLAVTWLVIATPLAVSRLRWLFQDHPRPRWLVLGIQLVYSHLLGALLCLPLLPLGVAIAWLLGEPAGFAVAAYGLGVGVAAYGVFVRRRRFVVRTLEVPCKSLPPELDGYRIAHLSDLHIGSYDGLSSGRRWVQATAALNPDLVAVTGDLVTSGTRFYAQAAEVLSALKAPGGVHVILGNHDQWDAALFTTELAARGVRVLDNEWLAPHPDDPDGERLVVAGLGDPYTGRAELEPTLAGRPKGFTVLLAHYPSWAKRAVGRNVGLVLAGHTHGGQVGVPWLSDRYNVARLTGQYPRGLFRIGDLQLYVSAGLGVSGPPIRLGVPPELTLLVLRAETSV